MKNLSIIFLCLFSMNVNALTVSDHTLSPSCLKVVNFLMSQNKLGSWDNPANGISIKRDGTFKEIQTDNTPGKPVEITISIEQPDSSVYSYCAIKLTKSKLVDEANYTVSQQVTDLYVNTDRGQLQSLVFEKLLDPAFLAHPSKSIGADGDCNSFPMFGFGGDIEKLEKFDSTNVLVEMEKTCKDVNTVLKNQ